MRNHFCRLVSRTKLVQNSDMGINFHQYRSINFQKLFRKLLRDITVTFLLFLLVGCQQGNLNFIKLPTATKVPYQPTPTAVPPTFALPPTQEKPIATAVPTLVVETRLYRDPENIFELSIPVSWIVSSDGDFTQFKDPSSSAEINVQFADTLYELDQESFVRAVDAREASVFDEFESYLETGRQINQGEDTYLIEKRLVENDESRTVISVYRQIGPTILILDLWSGIEDYEENKSQLSDILASLTVDRSVNVPTGIMSESLFSTSSNGSFSLEVPEFWYHKTSSTEKSVVDTFTSPDEQAIIQMVVYDDGEPITGSVAGAFVRNLLRNYSAKDITVSTYQYLPDGKEELVWESTGSDYQGITYFDSRDTELIIYTIMSTADAGQLYADLFTHVLNSFQELPSN